MQGRPTRCIAFGTVVLFALPYIVYGLERNAGRHLGSWGDLSGTNHGPWHHEFAGFTIFYPLFLLGVGTALFAVVQLVSRRPRAWHVLLLPPVQIGLAVLQLAHMFWLID